MEFICKYCGKICKNLNSLKQHERLCKSNPDHSISFFVKYNKSGHSPCNQYIKAKKLGLQKPEISEETRKKLSIAATKNNLARSKEINKKISNTCLERSKNGTWHKSLAKNMHYSYKGIDLDGRWELKFAQYLDNNSIVWERNSIRFEYYFEDAWHYYTPDFYLPETDEYIEIKGYKTKKDIAKWSQFPKDKKLKIYFEKDLKELGLI